MSHKHETWGWMLAVDFFFAGMGGAMLVIAGLADLIWGQGMTSILGNFIGPIGVCIGAGLLVLELGRPFQSWRVFMNPKAIIAFGAWNMLFAIGAGIIFASFGIDFLPWSGIVVARKFFAVCSVVFGLVVATYPGVLLGRHKGRPFWTGSGIMGLFLISSLVTGAACHILSHVLFPATNALVFKGLPGLASGLLALQLILWIGYVWIKVSGTTEREALAAKRWISGNYSGPFKGILLFAGTLLPLVLYLVSSDSAYLAFSSLLVLLGGVTMRLMVVYSGQDRTWLPGELKYRSRLPHGNEDFLKLLK